MIKPLLRIGVMVMTVGSAFAQTPPPPGAVPAAPPIAPVPAAPPPPYKSVIFPEADMARIYSAAQLYRVNLAKARELAKTAGQPLTGDVIARMQQGVLQVPEKPRQIIHPQYFLALIAYDGPENWAVTMNRHLYTPSAPQFEEIKVVGVSRSKVRFSWKPKNFAIYQERPLAAVGAQNVQVIKEEQRIEFALYPNQSFSAFSMGVVEGFLHPARVEQLKPPPSEAEAATPPGAAPAGAAPLPAAR